MKLNLIPKQSVLPINKIEGDSFLGDIFSSLKIQRVSGWPDVFGKKLFNYIGRNKKKPIYTLSLFTGCGGLDIGFHDAGFDIVEMVELEDKFVDSLRKNTGEGKYLGNARPVCMDIREYSPSFDHPIDFIIGGPPCQTFSAAGRRAAGVLGTTDPRGVLFQEYVRLLKQLKPKAFLFENVYGIVGAEGGRPWESIKAAFKEVGYTLHYRILDAADYGAPQHRERLIIVGVKDGVRNFAFPQPITGPDSPGGESYYTAKEAVSGLGLDKNRIQNLTGRYGHLLKNIPPGLNYSFYTKELGHPNPVFGWRSKFSDFLYKADPEKPVRAIKAQGGKYTGPFSWESRPFDIAEYKRLQTIPDEFELVGGRSKSIHQIGNSVPSQFARMLAISVINQIFDVKSPFKMRYLSPESKLGFRQRKRSLTGEYKQKAQDQIESKGIVNSIDKDFDELGKVTISLAKNFGIHSSDVEIKKSDLLCTSEIHFSLSKKKWTFSNSKNQLKKKSFGLRVVPVDENSWTLPTQEVQFDIDHLNEYSVTLLWKFFEKKILEVSGYADLVQLSGYYQYKPQIKIVTNERDSSPTSNLERVLNKILSGTLVAKEMNISEHASILNLDEQSTKEIFAQLKQAGYEIRNHNTNPQIKNDCYLIPYSFPTLTPNSVQLHKAL